MRVVYASGATPGAGAHGDRVRSGLGIALLTCGVAVAWAVVLLAGAFLVAAVMDETGTGTFPAELSAELDRAHATTLVAAWAITLVVALVVARVGLTVLRSGRHTLLFLRRFGYDDPTRTVTSALTRLGRSWRVVTLDDRQVEPMGVRRTPAARFLGRASQRGQPIAVVVAWAAAALASVLLWRGLDDLAAAVGGTAPTDPLARAVTVVGIVAVGTVVLINLVRILLVPFLPALLAHRRVAASATQADAAARFSVATPAQVEAAGRVVERFAHRALAPQLTVVRSSDTMWRAAVLRLLRGTEVTVVDVSRPTESLLWEIRALREHDDARCVFIARAERLARFVPDVARRAPAEWHVPQLEALATPPDSVHHRLDAALAGHDVLAYHGEPGSAHDFARVLRAHLTRALHEPRSTRLRPT